MAALRWMRQLQAPAPEGPPPIRRDADALKVLERADRYAALNCHSPRGEVATITVSDDNRRHVFAELSSGAVGLFDPVEDVVVALVNLPGRLRPQRRLQLDDHAI